MLSPAMPGDALSYQLMKLVVAACAAPVAHTSLKDELYCTRCEASTAGPELTVTTTGPPMVPAGNVTNISCPAFALHGTSALPLTMTHPELVEAPELTRWMLSASIPGEALSNQFR